MAEQKIWWGPIAEQKMVGALGHRVAGGTLSASAKRSAEQKMVELKMAELKLAEQKFGGDPWWNKKWWGPSATGWQGGPLVQMQKG